MNTRTFSYSLPWQNASGTPHVLSISQALVRYDLCSPGVAFQAWVGLHLYGRSGCMSTLEWVLKFRRRLTVFSLGSSGGYPNTVYQ
ncbi:hypothetical protein ACB092_04G085300 [Castanea dentata]